MNKVDAARELLRRKVATESFRDFLVFMETGFEFSAHHVLMIKELESVERGDTRNLMLMLPPGSAKSTYSSIYFPSWYLGRNPKNCVIACSHTLELAERFGRRARNVVGNELFRLLFDLGLSPDSQAAGRWETGLGGEYFAAGVGGSITGRRADLGIIDDPVKSREAADSEVQREMAWQWYLNDFLTRLKPGARQVVVQCMTGDTKVLMSDMTETNLCDLKAGDFVKTYENGRLTDTFVVDLRSQGEDDIYEISTSSGRKLRANLRHPFLVNSNGYMSWKRLGQLSVGDCLVSLPSGGIGKESPALNVKNRQEARGCVTLTTTKQDGLPGLGRRPHVTTQDKTQSCDTDTKSHQRTIRKFLKDKMDYAQFVDQKTGVLNTGEDAYVLTTATKQELSEDYYATTVTCLLEEAQQKKYLSEQQSICDFTTDKIVEIKKAGIEEVFDVQIARTENFIANGCVSHNTRWHEDDLAGRILEREADQWRVISLPMEAEGGDPLGRKEGELLWPEWFDQEMVDRAKADARSWSALYQQRPRPVGGGEFRRDWVNFYQSQPDGMKDSTNRYILVDAANEKRKGNDYTAMWVVGLGHDSNVYVLDLVRDRLNLTERTSELFRLHRKWKPMDVRYEKYGMMTDIEHIKTVQDSLNYRFHITEVGGNTPKNDRIRRLIPYFEQNRMWFPSSLHRTMHDGVTRELINDFVEKELLAFPVGKHDDMLDSLARLVEPELSLTWPSQDEEYKPRRYEKKVQSGSVWTA